MRRGTFVLLALGLWPGTGAAGPTVDQLALEFQRAGAEFDDALKIKPADPGRARDLFGLAAQRFESIAAAGVQNGYLEYNLGNAYLLMNDIGRAILHYRRAQRLVPRDPLLLENLRVARSRCLLNIPPARRSVLFRTLFFWHHQTSPSGRYAAALLGYAVFWIALALRAFFPWRGWLIAAALSGLIALASGGSLAAQRWIDRSLPDAVVIAADVPVYKGPAYTYEKQFQESLQPGVEVGAGEVRGDWRKVELSDGNAGWVRRNAIEIVPLKAGANGEATLSTF